MGEELGVIYHWKVKCLFEAWYWPLSYGMTDGLKGQIRYYLMLSFFFKDFVYLFDRERDRERRI